MSDKEKEKEKNKEKPKSTRDFILKETVPKRKEKKEKNSES